MQVAVAEIDAAQVFKFLEELVQVVDHRLVDVDVDRVRQAQRDQVTHVGKHVQQEAPLGLDVRQDRILVFEVGDFLRIKRDRFVFFCMDVIYLQQSELN